MHPPDAGRQVPNGPLLLSRRTGSSEAINAFLLNFSTFVEVKSCDFLTRTSDREQKVIANV